MLLESFNGKSRVVAQPFCILTVPKVRVPSPCVLRKRGYDAVCTVLLVTPRLRRYRHLWFPALRKQREGRGTPPRLGLVEFITPGEYALKG